MATGGVLAGTGASVATGGVLAGTGASVATGGVLVGTGASVATGGVGQPGGGMGTGGDPGTGGDVGAGGRGSGGDGSGGEGGDETCPLPADYDWISTGPLAQPAGDGWYALKDFSVTRYNDRYIVYGTVADGNWNGFFSTFERFDQWDTPEQHFHTGHVAPTLFYFAPKDIWVLTYQWGFQYKTSRTPDDFDSWSAAQPLISGDPTHGRGVGPIDQTVICDDTDCYIFFNDDAGGVYRGSMPIGQFPGTFSGITRIMDDPSIIFEGIQVYSIKGDDRYLMIIENNGIRAFRAWTAESLSGDWTPLPGARDTDNPFAGENNVAWPDGQWTRDISHGDIVRDNPSEKMEIDPCHLRLVYQGRDPNVHVPYGQLPYRPGVLTLDR